MNERKTIHLVEDSDTQALKLEILLQDAGYDVERSANAEQALECLRRKRPGLVILDYHLPGISGVELCRQIKMRSGIESVPVLLLTQEDEADVERRGLESGADDYIRKTVDDALLLARVESLLRSSRNSPFLSPNNTEHFRSQTILLVDDSVTYLTFLEHELESEGCRVLKATNGRDALSLIEKSVAQSTATQGCDRDEIDCIILDLVMPKMDGIELCRRLDVIRREQHRSLPILMVTSQEAKDEMMRALEAGADDFVKKSNDTVILRARIRALLRRKLLHDEHERILAQFRRKELEVVQAQTERAAALKQAALAKELEAANCELKETQSQLVQSAKMASLGALVAGIAHEINNPLSYSLSHLRRIADNLERFGRELCDIGAAPDMTRLEKAKQRAAQAVEGLERVADLIVKLRSFSRRDKGEFKLANVQECIEATLPIVRHRCTGNRKLVVEHAEDSVLYCAPGLINQVILNLLTNALDAIGEAGEVCVATVRTDKMFRLSVADSGPGIPDEVLERIFEPFFTTKDVGKGTGLGLAVSYQIIDRHKGSIDVRNRAAGGAEFIVELPLNLAEQISESRTAA